jgi:phospholipid/cholesterol/gamma-HCH transport system substrate-binding protein
MDTDMGTKKASLKLGIGLFIGLGFIAIVYLTMQIPANVPYLPKDLDTYQVTARFDDVGDLRPGAPVTIDGVRVGRITNITLDRILLKAVVTLGIKNRYRDIPDDSSVSINSVSVLGGEYLSLDPGGSTSYLRNGSRLSNTRSAFHLETVIKNFLKALGRT